MVTNHASTRRGLSDVFARLRFRALKYEQNSYEHRLVLASHLSY